MPPRRTADARPAPSGLRTRAKRVLNTAKPNTTGRDVDPAPAQLGSTPAAPRGRSLGGCATCRERHMKCDESRPTCNTCRRFGLVCAGYEVRITFTFEAGRDGVDANDNVASGRFRRPLFTERERKRMSDSLVQSVRPSTTSALLSLLEYEGAGLDDRPPENDVEILRGPFGLLKFDESNKEPPPSKPPRATAPPEVSVLAEQPADETVIAPPPPATQSPEHGEYDAENLEVVFDHAALSCLDGPVDEPGLAAEVSVSAAEADLLMSAILTDSALEIDMGMFGGDMEGNHDETQFTSMLEGDLGSSNAGAVLPPPPDGSGDGILWGPMPALPQQRIPNDTSFLLSHYRDGIANMFSPLRLHRTPWQTMFLPSAISTVGQLAIGMHSSHASLCVFYSLLATSALHLKSTTSDTTNRHWDLRAGECIELAQKELKLALQDQGCRPKRAKYKDTLMGLLAMITVAVFSGEWKHARCYLLDAERLIRRRGLVKTSKSKKVRSLHHCYALMRVIHESTFIGSDIQSDPNSPSSTRSDPSTPGASDPSLATNSDEQSPLRVHRWDGRLDQRLLIAKAATLGENDIHLGVPGRWDLTMYPSIYGVPEALLLLLSETTRLANERNVLQRTPKRSMLTWPQYLTRAKILEKCLCAWDPSTQTTYPAGWTPGASVAQVATNRRLVECMVRALHQSIVIYFYRRIHDLDPLILQDRVSAVLGCLVECGDLDADACATSPSAFLWTGFIAACECLDGAQQEAFSGWFRACGKGSGIRTFEVAGRAAAEVWARRAQGDIIAGNVSWVELSQRHNLQLFFT